MMPHKRPAVSIITPCYNGGKYLPETLRSAIRQTVWPLEVIVIDDGSTDQSAEIAEAFGAPVRVIRQANQGESVARNRGLSEARGTHVLFLDADDLLAPESLERLSNAVAGRPDAVAVMSCAWFSAEPSVPDYVKYAQHTSFYPEVISGNIAPPHCWLTPVAHVRNAGGFCESMRWFEDWDLWWRVGLQGPELVPVDYIGALYRQHPRSQLATTAMIDRTRGHAVLMSRMIAALLKRDDLLQAHGERLFWSAWAALTRAHENGVSWPELQPLANGLRALSRRGPASVTSGRMARAIRWLGVRWALALQTRPGS
jgi:glycosyltransferase involved in cell wall biosynthesis